MLELISQVDLDNKGIEGDRARSLYARLLISQGNLEDAGNWVDTLTDPPPDNPLMWLEEPQVTRVRVLVARGMDSDLQLAHQLLLKMMMH
jgi:hypothetical protein